LLVGAGLLLSGGAQAAVVPGSAGAEEQQSGGVEVQRSARAEEMVTRVITYTYDPLHRLTGAESL